MSDGSIRDEVLDAEHAVVVRTYIERWPRKNRAPGARHDDRFTMPFEEHAAWLAAQMPWTKASAWLRITWEALASIVVWVTADSAARLDRLDGLLMIGIDEKSRAKGTDKFLTAVTGHVTGKIAWMRAPQAMICLDAFHVVKWAGERLDELRRRLAAGLRAAGHEDQAAALGSGMRALRKKPENLTTGQRTALAKIAADSKPLYKGYLIKEQLRAAFRVKGNDGKPSSPA